MEELQAQNEALKKQCSSLQQEVKQWKKEYEILDACIELEQGKIAELKAENVRLKSYLQEIKAIAEYIMTSDTEKWTLDEPFKQIEKILELTKAEEE